MVKVFTVAAGLDSVETEERDCVPGIYFVRSVSRLTNKNPFLTMTVPLVFYLVNQSASSSVVTWYKKLLSLPQNIALYFSIF